MTDSKPKAKWLQERYALTPPWEKPFYSLVEEFEALLINKALEQAKNLTQAAYIMQINRTTLVEKMKRYRITYKKKMKV